VFFLKQCHILQAPCTWVGPKAIADAIRHNGAMTSLNLADNRIGGFYTGKGGIEEKFHPTPEGKKA
jgi:hypothetical protein